MITIRSTVGRNSVFPLRYDTGMADRFSYKQAYKSNM